MQLHNSYIEMVREARHERAGDQREEHEREPDEDGDAELAVEQRDGDSEREGRTPELPAEHEHLLDARHVHRDQVHHAADARLALSHSQRLDIGHS